MRRAFPVVIIGKALFYFGYGKHKWLINENMSFENCMKQPAVYIMANTYNGTLYVGVTSNLVQRVFCHRNSLTSGFSRRYNCKKLVYYELFNEMLQAIAREKQIKAGSRLKKLALIVSINPNWNDLYHQII